MRLHVRMLSAEELLGTIAREILDDIAEFAAAVIAASGVTFGIFVGEYGTRCFENGFADEVF